MIYSSSVEADGDVFLAPRRLCLAAVQSGSGTAPWVGGGEGEELMVHLPSLDYPPVASGKATTACDLNSWDRTTAYPPISIFHQRLFRVLRQHRLLLLGWLFATFLDIRLFHIASTLFLIYAMSSYTI